MITKKIDTNSLRNKKSNGKEVIYFEYTLLNNEEELTIRYNKMDSITWRVELVTQPHEQMPFRLFSEVFQLPNDSVPLTVVCGLGMLAIKDVLTIETQYYSLLQFNIADEVNKIANNSSNMR